MKNVNATAFKAHCLSILDEVSHTGEAVTITKRGRPVARLVTATSSTDGGFPQDSLKGTVEIVGDIVSPVLPTGEWEALRGAR